MTPGSSLPARGYSLSARGIALSAAVLLGTVPALATLPAAAAERIEFFDAIPGDAHYTGAPDSIEVMVSAMTPADAVTVTVDGREVLRTAEPANHRALDLCASCHLADLTDEEAEELDEAFFTRGEPTDIWLSAYLDAPLTDGAQITVRVGEAEVSGTFADVGWYDGAEWTPSTATTVRDAEVAASGLSLSGTLHPTELAPLDQVSHETIVFESTEDADIFWVLSGEPVPAQVGGGSLSGVLAPETPMDAVVFTWEDWDEEDWEDEEWVGEQAEKFGLDGESAATEALAETVTQLRAAAEAAGADAADTSGTAAAAEDAEDVEVPETATLAEVVSRPDAVMGQHLLSTEVMGETVPVFSVDDGDLYEIEHEGAPRPTEPGEEPSEEPGGKTPGGEPGEETPGSEQTGAPKEPSAGGEPEAAPSPRAHPGTLPRTGSELAAPLGVAAALLVVGGAAVAVSRVRRRL
ncbi:hypothetical protein [Brevibacterium album]|uniref:hypothetical protein n=1 Tax=Brevibacterium album TaxID=417948 RepID=UPI0004174F7E|nr:hypothetical protein [Brevibacterium album]